MNRRVLQAAQFNSTLVAVSGVSWVAFWFLNAWLFAATHFAPGISLIYVPAGIRLIILLLFGVWGAIGIALTDPILFWTEFDQQPVLEVAVNAVISGFVPLAGIRILQRASGMDTDLKRLKPLHLPALALTVSILAPLALTAQFFVCGLRPASDLLSGFFAMTLGDFLGCLLALLLAKIAIFYFRAWIPSG
ncbi:hypothetical protein [Aestuariivirga sp.]|uniref:hypothetical protein n=1 Tax=Aestuariivirga sp. TaxID=2650926 RepID=UPI003BAB209F